MVQAAAKPEYSFLFHPRRFWWRATLFQVHLWVGLISALYLCLVGTTGSILVFQNELYRLSRPALLTPLSTLPDNLITRIPGYLESAKTAFPNHHFTGLYLPRPDQPVVQMEGEPNHPTGFNDYILAYLDPSSGRLLGMTDNHFWISWVRELHVRLLSGRTGGIVNGCGACCLLALCVSGLVIWWPGLKNWSRALKVSFRRRLPRINFDLHSAIGFWTLLFVTIWATSGIYFTWPDQFVSMVDLVTPAKSAAYPQFRVTPKTSAANLLPMIRKAEAMQPRSRIAGIEFPEERDGALAVIISAHGELDPATYFFFDPYSGELLGRWERGPGSTLGTKLIYWLGPLHFGESWGLAFKAIWSLFGLSLPVLAVTGMLMYWNRFLSKKLRFPSRVSAPSVAPPVRLSS